MSLKLKIEEINNLSPLGERLINLGYFYTRVSAMNHHVLGPQQLKYMTVRSDSSACSCLSL